MGAVGFGILFPLIIVGTCWCIWKMLSTRVKTNVKKLTKTYRYQIGAILGLAIIVTVLYLGA